MIKFKTSLIACATLLLAGCTASRLPPDSRGVSFPRPEASYRSQGAVVLPATVQQVQPGLDKDQVRLILGNPHFTEGLFIVKDWNYRFELVVTQAERLKCQLQLQFDDADKVTAMHWQSGPCASAAGAPWPDEPVAAPRSESLSLHGLLFPFARSSLDDLPAADLARLEDFAAGVGAHSSQVQEVTIYGHADRIGPSERKQQRSLARAQAVAEVFVRSGIDPQKISIIARSASEPVTDCPGHVPTPQLLGCLAPDRRVTIAVRMAGA